MIDRLGRNYFPGNENTGGVNKVLGLKDKITVLRAHVTCFCFDGTAYLCVQKFGMFKLIVHFMSERKQ